MSLHLFFLSLTFLLSNLPILSCDKVPSTQNRLSSLMKETAQRGPDDVVSNIKPENDVPSDKSEVDKLLKGGVKRTTNQPQAYIYSCEPIRYARRDCMHAIVRFDKNRPAGIETFFDNFYRLLTTHPQISKLPLLCRNLILSRGYSSKSGPRERQIEFTYIPGESGKGELQLLLDMANSIPLKTTA